MTDVHPPLYFLILRAWTAAAGDGEIAARVLSLLCALAAAGVFAAAAAREGRVVAATATLFFTTSWLFPYFAQEARAYALLLLAGTAATAMDRRRAAAPEGVPLLPWLSALVVLSLVHYFGLLWAGVLLLGDLWRVRRQGGAAVRPRMAAGVAMLAWPLVHATFGTVMGRTGGNFWIQVSAIVGTLREFLEGIVGAPRSPLPLDPIVVNVSAFWAGFLFVAVGAGAAVARGRSRREILGLAGRVAAAVAIAALIDLHTPVSTQRNYIVLLPAMALLVGHAALALWTAPAPRPVRAAVAIAIVAYAAASFDHAVLRMRERWGPRENWKGLVRSVEAAGTCRPHCWIVSGDAWLGYYARSLETVPVAAGELIESPPRDPLPILAFHARQAEIARLRRSLRGWRCREPLQSWRRSVVILLPPRTAEPPDLRPCR